MSAKFETIDFGAPVNFGVHKFKVEIPTSHNQQISIIEVYGYQGDQRGIPQEEPRVYLQRKSWNAIAECARREFNARLKAKGIKTGRWHSGENFVERLLGRELCVLAWAAEKAKDEEIPIICQKWMALRPEERWWLFMMTVSEAGLPEDSNRGWRKALYYALSDGEAKFNTKRKPRPSNELKADIDLFTYTFTEGQNECAD
ncbi:MAG: DUF3780 domain-containing protein [Clostridia bacterium]|nr:DUF3780 domain-containing protein [Clostridia bacterium]